MKLDCMTFQTGPFKQTLSGIKDIEQDINLVFKQDGCTVLCTDKSQAYGLYAKFHADKFDKYHITENQVVWGVNLDVLTKLLGSSNCDTIRMYMEEGNDTNAVIEVTDKTNNCTTKNVLKLLDMSTIDLPIPDLEVTTYVNINSQLFNKKIKDIQRICDKITIRCQDDVLELDAQGDFANQKSEINLDVKNIQSSEDPPYDQTFYISSLIQYNKFSSLSNDITMYLIPNGLLYIEYNISTLGIVRCFIAPVQED